LIIGLTGHEGAGKETVAQYLNDNGFSPITASDIVKYEFMRKGLKPKKSKKDIDVLRSEFGNGLLGERAFEIVEEKEEDYVIYPITHPEEVAPLRKHGHFFLVEIRAPAKARGRRIGKQAGVDDVVKQTVKFADCVVGNVGTEMQLRKKIDKLTSDLRKKAAKRHVYVRPTWDEYFMGIVDATSKRATCDRGRTAVVIVRDRMILTTGYVGSPIGQPHCDEVGHQMKKLIHEDGHESQHCVRTIHGEVNAIALAARKGIAIDGATLYCKLEPCYTCAKMLINAGIKRVVCRKRYHAAQDTRELFAKAGVVLECLTDELEVYKNQ